MTGSTILTSHDSSQLHKVTAEMPLSSNDQTLNNHQPLCDASVLCCGPLVRAGPIEAPSIANGVLGRLEHMHRGMASINFSAGIKQRHAQLYGMLRPSAIYMPTLGM